MLLCFEVSAESIKVTLEKIVPTRGMIIILEYSKPTLNTIIIGARMNIAPIISKKPIMCTSPGI